MIEGPGRLGRYGALDEDVRRILQVLSVVSEPVGQAALQQVLDALGWRDADGALLSQRVTKDLRQRLDGAGLIEQRTQGMQCHPDLTEPLTRETLAAGTFGAIVAAAEQVVPVRRGQYWELSSEERRTRELRNALYAGREEETLSLLGAGVAQTASASQVRLAEVSRLARVCTRSPDAQWLAGLGPRLKLLALAPWLREAGLDLMTDADSNALAVRILTPLIPDYPDAADVLAEQRLLRGQLAGVGELLAGRKDPDALARLGWLQFLQGDYADAIATFESAEQGIRNLTRKRKVYLPGLPGALYLLALLRRGRREDFELVAQQVGICLRASVSDVVEPAYRVIRDLGSTLAGRSPAETAYHLRADLVMRGAVPVLLQSLARYWVGLPPAVNLLSRVAAYGHQAIQAGLRWYAHEAAALLGAVGFQGAYPLVGEPPAGLVLITRLLGPKSNWEIALAALQGVGRAPATGDGIAAPDRRLVWAITLKDGRAALEPREQKPTKRTGWSQGRAVPLQRLVEEPDSLPELSTQDREICACIVREQERALYYGAPSRTSYRLDQDRALLAAVGHPRVLRQGTLDAWVELARGGPTLAVVRQGDAILVRIDPFPPLDRAVVAVDETPQRIRLIHLDARHQELGRILGPEGLRVPVEAQARLLEGLTAIAPLLTIHADVDGAAERVEEVPGDPRPHLHLRPYGAGFWLDLHVHPLGDTGPELRPGQGGATLLTELAGRAVRCTRDLQAELTAARRVLTECPVLDGNDGWTWGLDDPELALNALEQLHALGDVVALDWPEGKRIALTGEIQPAQMRIKIKQQGDWLDLGGDLQLDDGRVLAMRELLELAGRSKGRFVRLGEDQVLVLSQALRRRLDGLRGLTDQGRFHPLAAPIIAELLDGMEVAPAPAWRTLLERLASARDLEPKLPSTLQAELRDYQLEGYRWLARLAHWGAGACLADDMGLGKTVQALALILARAPQGPTLVLAPTSVCGNWLDEARRFAPTLNPQRFGPGDRAAVLQEAGPFDLIISSYGLLQTEGDRLAEVPWQTLVADEAQAFKNALTKRSQAIMRLSGGFRMICTGTPIENRLGELWNLFRFINPGLLGSEERFNQRFANPIELNQDAAARQRLRQLLRPFILRRLKSEVLSELPPRTEITLRLELSAGEQALYEAARRQAIERLDQAAQTNPGQARIQLLAEIMRLRRACCHPRLALPDSDLPSAKLDAFSEIVDELLDNRHKALVFSQFVDHLSLIRQHLDARGIRYQYLDGSTPEPQRRAAVTAFQAGEGELFLISLRAGGVGLNLTAADYVIHMDPWWNPAVEDQASDRAHRIGQERPVTIYRLVAKDTIEERILKLHAIKRDLADGLLEGTGDGGRLSYEDMLALVRGAEGLASSG
jgi:hypothetical protein